MSDILERKIYQSNPLIESRKHMNLTEQRLLAIAMQGVKPKLTANANPEVYDLEFHEMVVPVSELRDLLDDNMGSIDNLKKSLTTAFQRAHIEIRFGRGGILLQHIFRKLKYIPNEGLLVQLDSELKPYILDLVNKSYTSYALKYVFPLSSGYGWRIMELMLQYKGMAKDTGAGDGSKVVKRNFTVEELRFKLDVPEGKYEGRMDNFQRFILDKPIDEINEKTTFKIHYETNKKGRSIVGFTLFMVMPAEAFAPPTITIENSVDNSETKALPSATKEQPAPYTIEASGLSEADFTKQLRREMRREGLAYNRIKYWFRKYGVEQANEIFRFALKRVSKKDIDGENRTRYIAKCMDDDWIAKNAEAEMEKFKTKKREGMSVIERLDAELLADSENYGGFHDGAPVPMTSKTLLAVIRKDLREHTLSLTTKRLLVESNTTVREFIELYGLTDKDDKKEQKS